MRVTFPHFEFDCTESLVEGENELLVEVYSPEEREENTRETIGGVWARWDGMDPGINPGGIFRDVTLVRRGEVRVLAVGVDVGPSGDGRVTLDLYARRGSQVEISGSVHPMDFEAPGAEFRHTARVEPGENQGGDELYVARAPAVVDVGQGRATPLRARSEVRRGRGAGAVRGAVRRVA